MKQKPERNSHLIELQGIHRDKVGIIYACGPTLNKFDINHIKDNSNAIHIAMKLAMLSPNVPKIDYYLFGDDNPKSKLYENKIKDLDCYKLGLVYHDHIWCKYCYSPAFCKSVGAKTASVSRKDGFERDINTYNLYKGTTVFPAIQLALWMGLTRLYIVGMDATEEQSYLNVEFKPRKANLETKINSAFKDYYKFKRKYYMKCKVIHVNPVNINNIFDKNMYI